MQRLSDEQLVIRCLGGEQAAFEVLVERYQRQIFSLAYRLHGDYDEAKDLAQEAFIRIYQELPNFDTERRFFPWMYRVAQNACINSLRKLPKESLTDDGQPEYDKRQLGEDPAQSYVNREYAQELALLLQEMPENYRQPILLKYIEGLSYQEISEKLDLSISTIESRLFRGRKFLRKLLEKTNL